MTINDTISFMVSDNKVKAEVVGRGPDWEKSVTIELLDDGRVLVDVLDSGIDKAWFHFNNIDEFKWFLLSLQNTFSRGKTNGNSDNFI